MQEVAKIAGWGDEQIEYMRERVTDEEGVRIFKRGQNLLKWLLTRLHFDGFSFS